MTSTIELLQTELFNGLATHSVYRATIRDEIGNITEQYDIRGGFENQIPVGTMPAPNHPIPGLVAAGFCG